MFYVGIIIAEKVVLIVFVYNFAVIISIFVIIAVMILLQR